MTDIEAQVFYVISRHVTHRSNPKAVLEWLRFRTNQVSWKYSLFQWA